MKWALRGSGAAWMALAGVLVLVTAGLETSGTAFATGLVLATLPVPMYFALTLWIDRFEPEPRRLIAFSFFWGATIAVFIAVVVNSIGEVIVEENFGADAATIYGNSISAPVVEESAKALALFALYWYRREEFNGIVDGIVYAAMVGLGFTWAEDVFYYTAGAFEDGFEGALVLFVVRGLLSPFAHPLFTAMTGLGLGIASRSKSPLGRVAPLAGLGAAIALHSIWNTAAGSDYAVGIYFLFFLPLLAGLQLIAAAARGREGKLVRRELQAELEAGLISPGELELLSSVRARRRAARAARRSGGRKASRTLRELQESATELAFHRDRVERGLARAKKTPARRFEQLLNEAKPLLSAQGTG